MRLPLLACSLFLAVFAFLSLVDYLRAAGPGPGGAVFAVAIAMRLSAVAYLVILAAAVVIRLRPVNRAAGLGPRIAALVGTFLIPFVVLFPRRELGFAGETIATLLVLAGNALAVIVLVQLGRSYSLMAEARRLVTSGAYRWVRHPLYLAEELAVIGIVLQFFSASTALLLAVQIGFQLRRMKNEERVLGETFPEFAAYRRRTAMLLPGVW